MIMQTVFAGRAEMAALSSPLDRRTPGWIALWGPRGSGKTALVSRLLVDREATLLRAAPMDAADLLEDFRNQLSSRFGEVPAPTGPGVLPDPTGEPGWGRLFLGLADRAASGGRPITLVLDGWEEMVAARRRLPVELGEALERARRRDAPFRVLLTLELPPDATSRLKPLGEPLASVGLNALPLRLAGRAHGGRDPLDAFCRWACLGGERPNLPSGFTGESWEEAVVERVLRPGGDLHDRPLHRLRERFQRPERYGSLTRALGAGPMDWSALRKRTGGIREGGQMAPYLRRLETEGIVVSEQPLDAEPTSRRRRYRLADPFWAFWMTCVLPVRSLLATADPWAVWHRAVRPRLEPHLANLLTLAVREWMVEHADEQLPAPAREVGALWGGEADFALVAWLTNGQICYVDAFWGDKPVGAEAYRDLQGRMADTRYGIGREARAPIIVLSGPAEEPLRRRVAGDPLAHLLSVEDLMGRDGFNREGD